MAACHLLVLSGFAAGANCATVALSTLRNEFVAALADEVRLTTSPPARIGVSVQARPSP